MQRSFSLAVLALVCAVSLGADCTSQATDPTTFCAEYVSIFCSGNQTCCATPDGVYAGSTTCETLRASTCPYGTGAAYSDGRAVFDSGTAAQALSEARDAVAACTAVPPLWAYDLVQGSIAVGGDCSPVGTDSSATVACTTGSTCVLTNGTSGLTGRCVATSFEGDACTADTCAAGSYCDFTSGSGVCTAYRNLGAACTSSSQCLVGSCVGFVCAPSAAGASYCVAGAQSL